MYKRDTEIRHLSPTDVYKLSLELDQSWKKLMRIIPKDLSQIKNTSITVVDGIDQQSVESILTKYTSDHILMVEKASRGQNRLSTEVLLEEWGTSGRVRPNVGNLLDLLVKAEIYRAADFVAINFLNEPRPQRPLTGPAAEIDISIPLPSEEVKHIESILNDISIPGTRSLNDNAQLGIVSEMNNKDFYEKFQNDEKNIGIEYSDLIKFSSSTIPSTSEYNDFDSTQSANIPNLTEIIETRNDMVILQNDLHEHDNENDDTIEIYQNGQSYENMEDDDDDNIPILSALNAQNISNDDENFPDISLLNADGKRNSDDSNTNGGNNTGENTSNNSRSGSFGNSSSLSINTDEGSNITSNLSILDPKSNDDSSLTNVTDTSENISFENDSINPMNNVEISLTVPTDESAEYSNSIIDSSSNNVPCLSELNITES